MLCHVVGTSFLLQATFQATHWLMDFRVVPDLWLSGGTCSGDSDLGIWCRSQHLTEITVILIIGALFLITPASGELDLRE